jgi:hypothetical protein
MVNTAFLQGVSLIPFSYLIRKIAQQFKTKGETFSSVQAILPFTAV